MADRPDYIACIRDPRFARNTLTLCGRTAYPRDTSIEPWLHNALVGGHGECCADCARVIRSALETHAEDEEVRRG